MRALRLMCASFTVFAAALRDVQVWHNASEGYAAFRIPGLVSCGGGLLVAVAEGRARDGFNPPGGDTADCYGEGASAADWNCTNKDVVVKRSTDNGLTWGASTVVPGTLATDDVFYSDPQLLWAPRSRTLWLEYASCTSAQHFKNCTLQLQSSRDGGLTWKPVPAPPHSPTLSGTSGGIVTTSGRLIFPNAGAGVFYSDDEGASWAAGAPVDIGSPTPVHYRGENMVAEVAGGGLLMTMRRKNNTRLLFDSADGGLTWSNARLQTVTDPDCQASMIAVRKGAAPPARLLFANPHTSGLLPYAVGRQNVTVQASSDGGATWQPLLLLRRGPSAYTAMSQLDPVGAGRDSCGALYEESADLPIDFRSIRFAAFDCETGA